MHTNFVRSVVSALLLGQTLSHTWIDQLNVISSNGSFVGNYGYPRAYVARGDTDDGWNGDNDVYLLPTADSGRLRINGSDLLCRENQRNTSTQSEKWPRLQAAPGDYIAMKYSENGHVTLPNTNKGKPAKGGTVFLYGTTDPSDEEKIMDVLEWTSDGTGGDGRGVLLGVNNYDDDRCYQLNSSPLSAERQQKFPDLTPGANEQYCESNLQIPTNLTSGATYTVYWVWQWPTAAGNDSTYPDGKDEWYTTCSDIDIVENSSVQKFASDSSEQEYVLIQQDPQTAAVTNWKSRTALTSDPKVGMAVTSSTSSGVAASTPVTTPAVSTPAISTPSVATAVVSSVTSAAAAAGDSGDAPVTVYITVTTTPGAQSYVTQMVTVTAEVPVATILQTTTTTMSVNVAFADKAKRSFNPRPQRRKARQSANLDVADQLAAKEAYCKVNTSDKGSCPDEEEEEQTQKMVRQVSTSAASLTGAAPSLMVLSFFVMIFAYAFA